jgi:hypothetical protein
MCLSYWRVWSGIKIYNSGVYVKRSISNECYVLIMLHAILVKIINGKTMDITSTILRYLSGQERIHHMFSYYQIVLIVKSLRKVEWDLKRISNLIRRINDYNVANKYDLTWQMYFIVKCLNQNIIDEGY